MVHDSRSLTEQNSKYGYDMSIYIPIRVKSSTTNTNIIEQNNKKIEKDLDQMKNRGSE
jgi:hypothetical protein